jgi:hypothetical protein
MDRSDNQPPILTNEHFAATVRAEVARSRRYGHPFAVFVLRPPAGPALSESLAAEQVSENLSALLTSGLVRECDFVSVLEDERAIGVMLPETGVAGAGALVERLLAAISHPEHEWSFDLFVYPEHQDEIAELAKKAA